MNNEPLLLTLLYSIAAVGAIGAINSRDTIRMVVSSLLAMFCLAGAVFHTSRIMALKEVAVAVAVVPEPTPAPTPIAAPTQPQIIVPDTAGMGASKSAAAMTQGRHDLRAVLDNAQRVLQNLSGFDLSRVTEVSDDEYQRMLGKAQGISAEARKLKERSEEAFGAAPEGLSGAVESLRAAILSMTNSSANLERFFKSENDTEERDRKAVYLQGVQAAQSALRKAELRLAKE